MATAYKS